MTGLDLMADLTVTYLAAEDVWLIRDRESQRVLRCIKAVDLAEGTSATDLLLGSILEMYCETCSAPLSDNTSPVCATCEHAVVEKLYSIAGRALPT